MNIKISIVILLVSFISIFAYKLTTNNSNNKINLAYRSVTSVATVYNVINKYSYNMYVINHMWEDLEDVITDEDKLEIILLLKLV